MNRTLMLLIPVVILVAMGLILLQQMWSGPEEPMQPESVAGGQLPFTNTTMPTPLSSTDLDEAIRREQMNRTQSAPELPPLEGMPQTAHTPTTPPATPPAATTGADNAKSELGKLADASVTGQASGTGSGAADELARQVEAGAQSGQAQTAPQSKPQAQQSQQVKGQQAQPPQAQTQQGQAQTTQTAAAQASPETKPVEPLDKFSMIAMSLKADGSDMILTLTADKRFNYKSFTLVSPDRLVIDLVGEWNGVKVPGMPSNRLISKVREGKFEGTHRIVMDLKAPLAGYETKRVDDNTVTVRMY